MGRRSSLAATILAGCIALAGCAVRSSQDRAAVSSKIQERTGHALSPADEQAALPPDISVEDGITPEEAVAIALWNNAAFQADAARLGVVRADLIDSKFLRNPAFSLLFPLGPKQLESVVSWPIEQLWLRPRKLRIAQKEVDRVAESLVQQGLDLVREVRVAHANARAALEQRTLLSQGAALENEITGIMQARLRAGDISEREAGLQQLAAAEADESTRQAGRDSMLAIEKLRGLLGWSEAGPELKLSVPSDPPIFSERVEAVLKDAFAARPDLRAAELAVEAAGERAKLEKSKIFSLTVVLDMNAEGQRGFEAGPGIQTEIPVVNLNAGGRARARAELEAARKRYIAARQRVAQDVRESFVRQQAAQESAGHWRSQILPQAEEELRLAQRAHETGDASFLAFLEARRSLLILQRRSVEAMAEGARARAELERSVGRRLDQK